MSPLFRKRLSFTLFFLGLFLISVAALPILISQIKYSLDATHSFIDPSAVSSFRPHLTVNVLGYVSPDYTQADTWFSLPPPVETTSSQVKYFTLSIPRLELDAVSVEVNGSNLKRGPIHYPGTAIPGAFGNTVIFGHSTLPQLYRPGSALSIFNPLPQAKVGDIVTINYDGVAYRYVIRLTREVKPTEIEVLAQRYDRRELTLVTCVPLGTYWRRFVATAELIN